MKLDEVEIRKQAVQPNQLCFMGYTLLEIILSGTYKTAVYMHLYSYYKTNAKSQISLDVIQLCLL